MQWLRESLGQQEGVLHRSVLVHSRSQEMGKGPSSFLSTPLCTQYFVDFFSIYQETTTTPMAQIRTLPIVLNKFPKARVGPRRRGGEIKHGIFCWFCMVPTQGKTKCQAGHSTCPHLHSMVSSLACSVSSMSKTSVISLMISALR